MQLNLGSSGPQTRRPWTNATCQRPWGKSHTSALSTVPKSLQLVREVLHNSSLKNVPSQLPLPLLPKVLESVWLAGAGLQVADPNEPLYPPRTLIICLSWTLFDSG